MKHKAPCKENRSNLAKLVAYCSSLCFEAQNMWCVRLRRVVRPTLGISVGSGVGKKLTAAWLLGASGVRWLTDEPCFNGNSRILKWRYILLRRPYIGLIYGRYLQFRFLKWILNVGLQICLVLAVECWVLNRHVDGGLSLLSFLSYGYVLSEVPICCIIRRDGIRFA